MESFLLIAGIWRGLYGFLLFLTALFLILLVLIQRGRGGGLAGAFGGMGGQSAFGTKAGDTFTKVTIVVATFWIVLCIVGVKYGSNVQSKMAEGSKLTAQPEGSDTLAPGTSDLEAPSETSSTEDAVGTVPAESDATSTPAGTDGDAAAASTPPEAPSGSGDAPQTP